MDMSFSPRDWPQMRAESRRRGESSGLEWRDLLARLDAAQAARISLNDAGERAKQGSFSPGSARTIETLGHAVQHSDRAVNQGISGNRNAGLGKACEEAGTELPGYARD